MVQLTIDNAKMQIPSPKSEIPHHKSPSPAACPICPSCSRRSRFFVVRDVHGVSANARCPKKTEHAQMQRPARQQGRIFECGTRIPNCGTFYHPVRRGGVHPSLSRRGAFGIGNSRKPGRKTQRRFTRFTRFTDFRCFISFRRFRSAWPL